MDVLTPAQVEAIRFAFARPRISKRERIARSVGESGPEMFTPKTSVTIVPNSVIRWR